MLEKIKKLCYQSGMLLAVGDRPSSVQCEVGVPIPSSCFFFGKRANHSGVL